MMYLLLDVVKQSKQYVRLGEKGRPDFEVEEWIASCVHMKRTELYVRYDYPLEEKELQCINEGLKSLKKGLPLAYLLGKASFWKDDFFVQSGVLIPRPETELLVEKGCFFIRQYGFSSVADVCTGSGCVGLSILKEMPSLRLIATDLYPLPIACAQKNCENLKRSMDIRQGNVLEPVGVGEVDFVVCNPPYLSYDEYEITDPSVRDFEPKEALVGGKKGIELYETLLNQALQKQVKAVLVEIDSQAKETVELLFEERGARSVVTFCDLFGRWRATFGAF